MKIPFFRSKKKEVLLSDLNIEENELKRLWENIISSLRTGKGKRELANLWNFKVRKNFKNIRKESKKVLYILKILHKLYGGNESLYSKEIENISRLNSLIKKITPSDEWFMQVKMDLEELIGDLDSQRASSGVTRMDFIKAAASGVITLGLANAAKSPSKSVFLEHPIDSPNQKDLPNIVMEEPVSVAPSEQLKKLLSEELSKKYRGKIDASLIDLKRAIFAKPELGSRYANSLIYESKKSIGHMANFYALDKVKLNFSIPKNRGDITQSNYCTVYLVSELSTGVIAKYRIRNKGQTFDEKIELPLKKEAGYSPRVINGIAAQGQISNSPIFYRTSGNRISIIETPAAEVLHKLSEGYTRSHIERESGGISFFDTAKVYGKWLRLEEVFVHSLVLNWILAYNKTLGIGLSESEIYAHFKEMEKLPNFHGVLRTAEKLSGIKKPIELYKSSPQEIFRTLD
ncbi:MAG TPA: hypothetical protein VI564_05305 [Candidatus Nanoarchaeia archaeon]|nr:hypothetical protein [Candidatus Nanoarchaeia archaeon]